MKWRKRNGPLINHDYGHRSYSADCTKWWPRLPEIWPELKHRFHSGKRRWCTHFCIQRKWPVWADQRRRDVHLENITTPSSSSSSSTSLSLSDEDDVDTILKPGTPENEHHESDSDISFHVQSIYLIENRDTPSLHYCQLRLTGVERDSLKCSTDFRHSPTMIRHGDPTMKCMFGVVQLKHRTSWSLTMICHVSKKWYPTMAGNVTKHGLGRVTKHALRPWLAEWQSMPFHHGFNKRWSPTMVWHMTNHCLGVQLAWINHYVQQCLVICTNQGLRPWMVICAQYDFRFRLIMLQTVVENYV